MQLLNKLFSGKQNAPTSPEDEVLEPLQRKPSMDDLLILSEQVKTQKPVPLDLAEETVAAAKAAATNIWDIEEPSVAPTEAPGSDDTSAASRKSRRNRTRLIGFEGSESETADPFDQAPADANSKVSKFPVGWLLLIDGPGRGHAFTLVSGMSQIGRGEEQAVRLDFGDNAISRNNHAAVVYDSETRTFLLGHGGKANIVRLNGKPVISNEELKDGDKISLGESVLQLKTLCGAEFDWDGGAADDNEVTDDDVAIA